MALADRWKRRIQSLVGSVPFIAMYLSFLFGALGAPDTPGAQLERWISGLEAGDHAEAASARLRRLRNVKVGSGSKSELRTVS
ncbi:hypothetical protein [Wenjunlia tyrosinilytica]|uniref:hypothetical protein n=1 Tax=Wenjunlia tyrosinilytica TaxID=1544741 RepID=UPI00166524E9|nr:hypothetical protein [Wenjunlia tyrosinilytica]